MAPLTTFTLFPHLPFELRLKIWEIALSEPRTVTISCERAMLDRERRFAKAFTSSTLPPPLLRVNRESRFEALARYNPSFKTDTSPNLTYISFAQDTLRCADSILSYMPPNEVSSIQRLVLEVKDTEYFGHFHMDVVKRMSGLREMELLANPDNEVPWSVGGVRYITMLTRDVKEAMYENPAWECPKVRIVNWTTGEEVRVIEGGPLIPGWKHG